jgi:hypothetical protein
LLLFLLFTACASDDSDSISVDDSLDTQDIEVGEIDLSSEYSKEDLEKWSLLYEDDDVRVTSPDNSFKIGSEYLAINVFNKTDNELVFSYNCGPQFESDDKWINVEFSEPVLFFDLAYSIEAQNNRIHTFYLYPDFYDYSEGNYRIALNFGRIYEGDLRWTNIGTKMIPFCLEE